MLYLTGLEITSSKLLGLVPSIIVERETDISEVVKLYECDLPSPELANSKIARWRSKFLQMEKSAIPNHVQLH